MNETIYAIYAIYDPEFENIYRISYCKRYSLKATRYYYEYNSKRTLEVIFPYVSLKFGTMSIEELIEDLERRLQPVVLHRLSKYGNHKRIHKQRNKDCFIDSILGRNGDISPTKMALAGLKLLLNGYTTIEDLKQSEEYRCYTDRDYIPSNFWDYGLQIEQLPKKLQRQYENCIRD